MPLTIVELVDRYIAWGRTYYVKPDGVTLTGENAMISTAVRPLLKLYARMPARKFRPRHLLAVRGALVDSERYARKQVNDHVGRIKRLFAWGVEHELVPGRVPERLRSVRGLRRGKTTARDNPPVRAVSDATIALTMPWLPPVVRAMVQLQRLTGARPGEICDLRPADVDTTGEVWAYTPREHKTAHHGIERFIYIGPRGQHVLRPFLLRPADAFCFSPADSERKRKRELRDKRRTKVQPSQRDRSKAKPKRTLRDHYTKDTYNRAIARAVTAANKAEAAAAANERRDPNPIPKWTPNMLRHTRATELRREFGIEAARVALGHSDAGITLVYAEADQKLAADVARRTG